MSLQHEDTTPPVSEAAASAKTNGTKKLKQPQDIIPWYKRIRDADNFHRCCRKVEVTHTSHGHIVYDLLLEEEHVNFGGSAHGGLLMTVIDESSILSVWLLDQGSDSPHIVVTVNASINCISTARLGETIVFDAKVSKTGSTLSYVTVTVTEKTSGRLIATGNVIAFTKTRGPYLAFTDLTNEEYFARRRLAAMKTSG